MRQGICVFGIKNIPEVLPGNDVGHLILAASINQGIALASRDILVVTQKIISKAEGQIIHLGTVIPSPLAVHFATKYGKDPRQIEIILQESQRIVRMERGIIISETRHGLICANAGVDASNMPERDTVSLLPINPDGSATQIRETIRSRLGISIAVIISDTVGRPWRDGAANVAIGVAGIDPITDYRKERDAYGYPLRSTMISVADELAAAGELVSGKNTMVPAAIIRGYQYRENESGSRKLLRSPEDDLFR